MIREEILELFKMKFKLHLLHKDNKKAEELYEAYLHYLTGQETLETLIKKGIF